MFFEFILSASTNTGVNCSTTPRRSLSTTRSTRIPSAIVSPVKFFGGKAALGYHNAKLIIKLANDVAQVINRYSSVRGLMKIALVSNDNVRKAEILKPTAELSEQISTAGMEVSGT